MSPLCPKNSESRFISWTIKYIRKFFRVHGVVTYADIDQGHKGTIYKATGFTLIKITDAKKDFVSNGKKIQRGKVKDLEGEWIHRSQKYLFVKKFK